MSETAKELTPRLLGETLVNQKEKEQGYTKMGKKYKQVIYRSGKLTGTR